MHLVHAVFLALCLGLGVFALDDDVDVLLGVGLVGFPYGDIDRLAVAAKFNRLLDPDLLLLVAVLTNEGLQDFLAHTLLGGVPALCHTVDEVQYGLRAG